MLISIIVPVYNKEAFLDNCLTSLNNQQDEELEIIIINDGSTDNSEAVIKKWLKTDERIQYVFQENQGVAVARNEGINRAKGEYLLFVDADDALTDEAVSRLSASLVETASDILIANYREQRGELIEQADPLPNKLFEPDDLQSSQVKADMFLIGARPMASACNKLYKRSFLLKNNLKFENDVFAEDRLFNLMCYVNDPKIALINEYTYTVNILECSRSRSYDKNFLQQNISLFFRLFQYLQKNTKLNSHKDLLHLTLVYDLDKIFYYINAYSLEKNSIFKVSISLLKSNKLIVQTLKEAMKYRTIGRITGKTKYRSRLRLMSYLFLYGPSILMTFKYTMFFRFRW